MTDARLGVGDTAAGTLPSQGLPASKEAWQPHWANGATWWLTWARLCAFSLLLMPFLPSWPGLTCFSSLLLSQHVLSSWLYFLLYPALFQHYFTCTFIILTPFFPPRLPWNLPILDRSHSARAFTPGVPPGSQRVDWIKLLLSFWQVKGKSNHFEICSEHSFQLNKILLSWKNTHQKPVNLKEGKYQTSGPSGFPILPTTEGKKPKIPSESHSSGYRLTENWDLVIGLLNAFPPSTPYHHINRVVIY